MKRPKIICHILMSIDGRIAGDFFRLPETGKAAVEYRNLRGGFNGEAIIYGRTTAEEVLTKGHAPDLSAYGNVVLRREDFIADNSAANYLAVLDPEGGLGWTKPVVEGRGPGYDGAHIVELLTEKVPDAYLAYLQKIGVSYLFCGTDTLSCAQAAEKLHEWFGVQTALLQGGGVANGSFAAEGLIDELSLVIVPALQGGGAPCLIETAQGLKVPQAYTVCDLYPLPGGGIRLHYCRKQAKKS